MSRRLELRLRRLALIVATKDGSVSSSAYIERASLRWVKTPARHVLLAYGRLPTGVIIGSSGCATRIVDLALALRARKSGALGLIARCHNVVAVGIAPETLGILRPLTRAVMVEHVAAVIGLTTTVIVIDAGGTRQSRTIRIIRSCRIGRPVACVAL